MSASSSLPMSLNTAPVTLESRSVSYRVGRDKQLAILDQISFTARSGEFIGIVGPNGAGKTTLLRNLGGLLRPASGQVLLNGRPLQQIRPRDLSRLCAYMHQDTVMPFAFPVREVVLMGRHPYSSSFTAYSVHDEAYVQQCLETAGCLEEADKLVTELSGGERQRVMFARILAQDTPLLLLDEPTSSLDIRYAHEVFQTARELAAAGKLVIAVMHDLRQAAKYCSRLFLVYQGQLVASGDPVDVLHEGHISYAYGVRAATFANPAGQWDYYVKD
ncbi:MAG TPA: ABC transporter ATP-binding protein [Clostridiales bacterium]|nr:ABC transporter ATP-binding protein [Clostridiales bacterium]